MRDHWTDGAIVVLAIAIVLTAIFGFNRGVTAPSHATHEATGSGFYRHRSDATVYRLGENRSYCIVANPSQMAAFGGFGAVKTVDDSDDFLAGLHPASLTTPHCGWPDGSYRIAGTMTAYAISGVTVCRLSLDRARERHVVPVSADSNVLETKRFAGNCPR